MSTPTTPTTSAAPAVLTAVDLDVAYAGRRVVADLDLAIAPGSWTALVGPNGSGKSTVLRAMSRLVSPSAGQVLLDGVDLVSWGTRSVARRLAVLPQGPLPPHGITVRELVEQGRHPHRGLVGAVSAADRDSVAEALDLTGTTEFADRYVDRLSGGERQRVWLALALAQQTEVLLLDEPTTFLDIGHQLDVLDLVAELRRTRGLTVVTVLHDLDHAARYADRVIVLREGRLLADGPPRDVVTESLVADAFGVRCSVLADPVTGCPVVLPYAGTRAAAPALTDQGNPR